MSYSISTLLIRNLQDVFDENDPRGDYLDARNYRLRRSGQDVKLERIPLELLLLLADRAGEVVTREEIAERLWGKGVQLDTENADQHGDSEDPSGTPMVFGIIPECPLVS